MHDVLVDGSGLVMSQNRLNIERENQVISQWRGLFKDASSAMLPPHPNNRKIGPNVSVSPWNQTPKRFSTFFKNDF